MTVSRARRSGGYSVAARGAMALGKYAGKRVVNSFTRKKNSSSGSSTSNSNNVTFQHDYAHIYNRKKAPRRVVRRAKKAAGRFESQLVRTLGQKTWNRTDTFSSGTVTPTGLDNCQTIFSLGMFGGQPADNAWGDLFEIVDGEGLLTTTGKLHFKSCCMDVQIRNATSSFTTSPSPVTLVVDLYTVYARRDGFNNPSADWTSAMAEQSLNGISGQLAVPQSLNCTPFDGPGFGSSWLIAKKMRYRIAPGSSVYLQLREHRKMQFETGRLEYDLSAATPRIKMFKGMTRGYMFVIRSDTPVTLGGGIKSIVPYSFDMIYTKNYKYARQISATDQQTFNA